MCGMAVTVVEAFCKGTTSGDITVKNLELIGENREQMKKLIDATSTKSTIMKLIPVGDSVQQALDRRLRELEEVITCKDELKNLYIHICSSKARQFYIAMLFLFPLATASTPLDIALPLELNLVEL